MKNIAQLIRSVLIYKINFAPSIETTLKSKMNSKLNKITVLKYRVVQQYKENVDLLIVHIVDT